LIYKEIYGDMFIPRSFVVPVGDSLIWPKETRGTLGLGFDLGRARFSIRVSIRVRVREYVYSEILCCAGGR
jgi:hypothetical protein